MKLGKQQKKIIAIFMRIPLWLFFLIMIFIASLSFPFAPRIFAKFMHTIGNRLAVRYLRLKDFHK